MSKLIKQCKRGAAAIEFALVAPILFLLLLGTLEFGLTIFVDSTMQQALRASARNGMVRPQTMEDINNTMRHYMQGLWREGNQLRVCVRAYPNIVNAITPVDAAGNTLPSSQAQYIVNPELARFADNPNLMFNNCDQIPGAVEQQNAVMLYTAEYAWGGKTNMLQPLIPASLRAVTLVRNEFGQ